MMQDAPFPAVILSLPLQVDARAAAGLPRRLHAARRRLVLGAGDPERARTEPVEGALGDGRRVRRHDGQQR